MKRYFREDRHNKMIALSASLLVFASFSACKTSSPASSNSTAQPKSGDKQEAFAKKGGHLPYGISAPSKSNSVQIEDEAISLSFNCDEGVANWAAWSLESSDIGSADRSSFFADTRLPANCLTVSPKDYTNSGFDRGHLVPSADRTASPSINKLVFSMINIAPQAPKMNQSTWRNLEEYFRTVAKSNSKTYNVVGLLGNKGTMKGTKIRVPEYFWRAALIEKSVSGSSKPQWEGFAVLMPNSEENLQPNWEKYKISIDSLEAKTGFDFNPQMEKGLQSEAEK